MALVFDWQALLSCIWNTMGRWRFYYQARRNNKTEQHEYILFLKDRNISGSEENTISKRVTQSSTDITSYTTGNKFLTRTWTTGKSIIQNEAVYFYHILAGRIRQAAPQATRPASTASQVLLPRGALWRRQEWQRQGPSLSLHTERNLSVSIWLLNYFGELLGFLPRTASYPTNKWITLRLFWKKEREPWILSSCQPDKNLYSWSSG